MQKERPMTILSVLILFLLLLSSEDVEWGEGIKFSVVFTIIIKLILAIPAEITYVLLIKYQYIKTATVQLIKLAIVFMLQGWYIYVWTKFFDSENHCKTENYWLYLADLFIVIEAFMVFLTMWWCVSIIAWILVWF